MNDIKSFFQQHKSVVVALSGGVDSAVLLALSLKYADKTAACFVKTDLQPEFELKDAQNVCSKLNIKLNVLNADIFSDSNIVSNNADRCYHCKKMMFKKIKDFAEKSGGGFIVEGTNADDDIADRPGYKALTELGILSPLRLCGITKKKIRDYARGIDLPVGDKPSYACLATRIYKGEPITKSKLGNISAAESAMFQMGFSDFRIRQKGSNAKIELCGKDFSLLVSKRKSIYDILSNYYNDIFVDLKERNSDG